MKGHENISLWHEGDERAWKDKLGHEGDERAWKYKFMAWRRWKGIKRQVYGMKLMNGHKEISLWHEVDKRTLKDKFMAWRRWKDMKR